jgi:23S rRNA (adenine2503-C2)-methyltransferase
MNLISKQYHTTYTSSYGKKTPARRGKPRSGGMPRGRCRRPDGVPRAKRREETMALSHEDHHRRGGKIHLRDLSLDELREFVTGHEAPLYRYRQIAAWLYDKYAADFSEMTNLPLVFRQQLREEAEVGSLKTAEVQTSAIDGTQKFLFELHDGKLVEGVLMPHGPRVTMCVSSQVGCPLDCVFCQTGKGVFGRNLTAGEILDEICFLKKACGPDVDKVNIVFMGMGEPLLNYRSLVKAIRVLNDAEGLDMGAKRITVSTSGLPRRMRNLADEALRCSLALSLNATTDAQRAALMPAVSHYPIADVLDAADYFSRKSGRRVTLEYVLLRGVNTSIDDARRLGKLSQRGRFKVNLIPYNPGRDAQFETIGEEEIQAFIKALLPYAPTVTVRRSKGPDIDAACGQLWTQTLAGKKKPAKET